MRKYGMTSGVLAAVFAFGLVACDSSSGTTENDTVETTDTVGGDTATESDTSTETDTTTADPCDPNPCTTPPAAACNEGGTAVVAYAATGTCTDNAGAASCEYTSTETACEGGQICSGAACADPGDPCDYAFDSKVSYITHLALGSQAAASAGAKPADDCCFDYTGDGVVDNKLGNILALAGTLIGDLNATIQEQVESGSLVVLLETKNVTDAANSSDVTINGFLGEDADADLTNNASGTASFTVNNSSFKEGTKEPLISFSGAEISSSVLTAGPSLFQLSIPILEGAVLSLAITQTRIEATVATGPNGEGLTMDGDVTDPDTGDAYGAKLGGVITQDDLFAGINGFMDASCVTINDDDGKLVSFDSSTGKWSCAKTADQDTSACEDGDPATQLGSYCGALLAFIVPDVDTNDDGKKDAISIGIWVKATSATALKDPACNQ
ncbi:MAG: hypothetical protein EP329_16010 [Deltaproteobacteria bacterium]|nr:MAG: hypothetical protein EP329_16010 [Deltaproteobacteria bacterium]